MERRRRASGRAALIVRRPTSGRSGVRLLRAFRLALAALALALGPAFAQSPPERLGGALDLGPERLARWCWSGAFQFPVGDPRNLDLPGADGAPPFRVNRNVGEAGGHQGADLDNRRAGDAVRAAAHGLVLSAADGGWNGGYGGHVVLAHRLPDETLAYSVYAHLAPGSVRAHTGDAVFGGEVLGRVGSTGRATTAHLHFEIRRPASPGDRWERARVVDPIAFVLARLPLGADTSWARAYFEWAEDAALMTAGARPEAALDRASWWMMMARAARHDLPRLPEDPAGLRPLLASAGLLPVEAGTSEGATVGWAELQRDLDRLRETGLRLPPAKVAAEDHRARCALELPEHGQRLPRDTPTLAQACLGLADLAVAAAEAPAPPRTQRNHKRR